MDDLMGDRGLSLDTVVPTAPPVRCRGFVFALDATREQEHLFRRFAGARRYVYNWALGVRKDHYKEHQKTLSAKELGQRLTALKRQKETAWLQEIDSQLLQQGLRDLLRAYTNFFAHRARFPRFKSKKTDPLRFRIPQRIQVQEGKVFLPKIGWVKLRQSREIVGTVKGATVTQEATGRWYVSLTVEDPFPQMALPPPDPALTVGLDLGVRDAVVLNTGEKIPAPRFYRKAEQRLQHAQRSLSRKQKGSNNRAKARKKVARLHAKVANQRKDFLHKVTTDLVRRHDALVIEDLNVQGLARTKLAKSILDLAPGTFRRFLTYKCQDYGRHLVVVDPFFPSTKRCAHCRSINPHLTLKNREWICGNCGRHHDRDTNAALNLYQEGAILLNALFNRGTRGKQNAWGASISLSTAQHEAENQESPVF